MAHCERLPCELIEEKLSRVPPKSLVFFRTVSKKWKALLDDKTFIKNHKWTFQFILATKSKFYSVSINPEVVVRELTLDIPGLGSQIPRKLVNCNEFLLCCMDKVGTVVSNPWLNQIRVIKTRPGSQITGIGYDNHKSVKENIYKAIAYYWNDKAESLWTVHDFATDEWTECKSEYDGNGKIIKRAKLHITSGVSLNGNLYWVCFYGDEPLYYVTEFDFSSGEFIKFCYLPCLKNRPSDALVLGVFKVDGLSLLKQCHETKKINIWVTNNKVKHDNVVWKNFMEVSIPNLPSLIHSQPSYFIDGKKVVVCSCDQTGRAWIYVLEENKLVDKIKLDSVVDHWPLHCTYYPSSVPVPRGQDKSESYKFSLITFGSCFRC